ncbi:MAG: heme exporter protein CcmB [Rickettsiaceae bacterium]|jgi:heme exporter protein B|nr:heme exporter protein CcmB [Rickettsiaceae bacterium]MCP5378363.1 heme exporter protein CcmB [Rickettsiaceae bacterium]
MVHFIKHEFLLQNKICNLTKYFFIFFVFCSGSITIVSSHDKIANLGIIFAVISIPLSLIGIAANFLRTELEDGTLEILLTSFRPIQIILAKYLGLFICGSLAFVLNIPISYFLFNIEAFQLNLVIITGLLLMATSCGVVILISSIQCYFRSNTNFLSTLLLPLIIPSIILSGIIIQSDNNNSSLLLILIGVNCIIVPISIYLSSYLIENIYNI